MLAGFRAPLAMLGLVLSAFGRAGVANVCAKVAELGMKPRVADHEGRAAPAQIGAVATEPCAIGHVVHAGAFVAAMLARLGAMHARLDTGLMFVMCHGMILRNR